MVSEVRHDGVRRGEGTDTELSAGIPHGNLLVVGRHTAAQRVGDVVRAGGYPSRRRACGAHYDAQLGCDGA